MAVLVAGVACGGCICVYMWLCLYVCVGVRAWECARGGEGYREGEGGRARVKISLTGDVRVYAGKRRADVGGII